MEAAVYADMLMPIGKSIKTCLRSRPEQTAIYGLVNAKDTYRVELVGSQFFITPSITVVHDVQDRIVVGIGVDARRLHISYLARRCSLVPSTGMAGSGSYIARLAVLRATGDLAKLARYTVVKIVYSQRDEPYYGQLQTVFWTTTSVRLLPDVMQRVVHYIGAIGQQDRLTAQTRIVSSRKWVASVLSKLPCRRISSLKQQLIDIHNESADRLSRDDELVDILQQLDNGDSVALRHRRDVIVEKCIGALERRKYQLRADLQHLTNIVADHRRRREEPLTQLVAKLLLDADTTSVDRLPADKLCALRVEIEMGKYYGRCFGTVQGWRRIDSAWGHHLEVHVDSVVAEIDVRSRDGTPLHVVEADDAWVRRSGLLAKLQGQLGVARLSPSQGIRYADILTEDAFHEMDENTYIGILIRLLDTADIVFLFGQVYVDDDGKTGIHDIHRITDSNSGDGALLVLDKSGTYHAILAKFADQQL
jgi:hypothetical protein